MCADDERKRWTANAVRLGVLTLGVCLLGLAGPPQAGGQNTATASHTVAVKSDPPGAIIWKKEGRDYTCTNTLTPGTVELAFHDDNDVQRIRVRRFGYSDVNLDVKSTDKEVGVALNSSKPVSSSFLVESDAPPEVKPLNEALKKEFEKTLLTDPEAFRCALSNNVGAVKHFLSTLLRALGRRARHFALVEALAFALPTKARS
jgi:hypothetical protein